MKLVEPADYQGRRSFYSKARTFIQGDFEVLRSYETNVAEVYIPDGTIQIHEGSSDKSGNGHSATTCRHINAWLHSLGVDKHYTKSELDAAPTINI